MATIANLVAKLSGNTVQFESKFEKVAKQIGDLQRRFDLIKSPISKFKALLGALGIFAGVYYAKSIVDAKLKTLQFARVINDSVGNIDLMKTAIKSIGGDADAAERGLGKLVHLISEASHGGAYAADVFARLGLDAAKLAKMQPSEAFWVIADQLAGIEDAGQRAAMATQIFGDDAAALLPVLSQGSKALADAKKEMGKFGGVVSDLKLTQLELATIQFEQIKDGVENAALILISELAPTILMIAGDTKGWVETIMNGLEWCKAIAKAFGYIYLVVNNTYHGVMLLFDTMKLGVMGITKFIHMMFSTVINGVAAALKAVGIISETTQQQINATMKQMGDNVDSNIAAQKKKVMDRALDKLIDINAIDSWFNGVATGAENAAKKQDKLAKAGGAVAKAFANQALYGARAKAVIEENLTPFQKYNQQMTELDSLLESGAIGWDTYGRAVAKAVAELESANSLGNVSLASAERFGTGGAASAINKSKMENEMRNKEKPQERLERVAKQSLDVQKDQLDTTKQIARAAQNRKVYTIPR